MKVDFLDFFRIGMVMDVMELKFKDGSFDVVIDKGKDEVNQLIDKVRDRHDGCFNE